MENLQNWWKLSTIQIGGVICLPVIMIGQTLSQHYGFATAVYSIIIGNALLLLMGLVTAKMCYANRKTTMENAGDYFGERGVSFFAFVMMVSLVGWFGIQLDMMGLGVLDLFSISENREFWRLFFNISLGVVITFAALQGIKGIGFLADLALPFLFLTLGYAAFTVEDAKNLTLSNASFSYAGASLVVALAIAFVIDMPTFYRFAKTSKDGLISISLIFVFVLPGLEIIGVYLASGSSGGNILEVLKRDNETFWNFWVALFIILAGWTTNNVNLYSAAICLQTLKKNLSEKKSTLLMGGAGILLSCFDLLTHLEFVLDVIGIFISSMGAVILIRYLMMEYYGLNLSLKDHPRCLLAWVLGIVAGFIGISGYSLTSIALLDAALGASMGTILTMKRKEYYEKVEY